MKRLMSAVFASLLLATAPAFAGGGHGHGHDKHHDKWEQKQSKKDRKAWEKEQKHWAKHDRGFYEREVVNNYYYPEPRVVERHVYVERPYSQPGAFVTAPGIYINLSN